MPLLIHCTQKLLLHLGTASLTRPLGAWAGMPICCGSSRKCVLFTQDETLYSVFVQGLRKPELEQLDEVFGHRLFKALVWDAFSQMQIERMLEACRVIRFMRSSNRSVAGLDERHSG